MRVDVSKTAAVFLVITAALFGYGDETAWFNAAFDDYAVGETLSDKGAVGGTWAPMEDGEYAVKTDAAGIPAIRLSSANGDDALAAFVADESAGVASWSVDLKGNFPAAVAFNSQLPTSRFGFTLATDDEGAFFFAGVVEGTWYRLAAEKVTPTTNTWYEVRIATRVIGEKTYADFTLLTEGAALPLQTEEGQRYFSVDSEPLKTAHRVRIVGAGYFGAFEGIRRAEEEPDVVRADAALDVSAPSFERPLVVESSTSNAAPITVRWFRSDGRNADEKTDWTLVAQGASYQPSLEDAEHWLRCVVTDGFGELLRKEFYFSRLPVLYMRTDDGWEPSDFKEERAGTIYIQGNDEWASPYDGKMVVKVRGNSSRNFQKKPWKLKLDKKAELLGMPKSKHWVLLANYTDDSAMRNKLAYDFANEIGNLGMRSTWCVVFMRGTYRGLYQLCEHIRVDKNRVKVFDWEGLAEDNGTPDDLSWVDPAVEDISGGYLFESSSEYDEDPKFTITSGGLNLQVMVNTPECLATNPEMLNWCKTYLSDFCAAMTGQRGYANGHHWFDYADADSMASFFLVNELFANVDAWQKSRYFYKDRGEKLKFGPVWDFDFSSGNTTLALGDTVNQLVTLRDIAGKNTSFFREWVNDPKFVRRVYTLYWTKARSVLLRMIGENGEMDAYKDYLAEAGKANDVMIFPMREAGIWQGWVKNRGVGFTDETEVLREFLRRRLDWMDAVLEDIPTAMEIFRQSMSIPPTNPYSPLNGLLMQFK